MWIFRGVPLPGIAGMCFSVNTRGCCPYVISSSTWWQWPCHVPCITCSSAESEFSGKCSTKVPWKGNHFKRKWIIFQPWIFRWVFLVVFRIVSVSFVEMANRMLPTRIIKLPSTTIIRSFSRGENGNDKEFDQLSFRITLFKKRNRHDAKV